MISTVPENDIKVKIECDRTEMPIRFVVSRLSTDRLLPSVKDVELLTNDISIETILEEHEGYLFKVMLVHSTGDLTSAQAEFWNGAPRSRCEKWFTDLVRGM